MAMPPGAQSVLTANVSIFGSNFFSLAAGRWDTNIVTVPDGQGCVGMAFFAKRPPSDTRFALALYSTYPDGSGGQWNYPSMDNDANVFNATDADCALVGFAGCPAPIIVGAQFFKLAQGGVASLRFLLADGQWYQNQDNNNGCKVTAIDTSPLAGPYVGRPGLPYWAGGGIGYLDGRAMPALCLGYQLPPPTPTDY